MTEGSESNKREKSIDELKKEFESLDDLGIAYSIITGDLLRSGEEGERKVFKFTKRQ